LMEDDVEFEKAKLKSGVKGMALGIGSGIVGMVFVLRCVPQPTPAPIHVEAAVSASKWEDERFKRLEGQLEHRMDRLEDRINGHAEMIGHLTERASLHRHVKSGQACGPYDWDAGVCAH
jgi:hypothetical protein